ncbi:hypothetical protein VTN96DRAFT_9731 [Rasamsonia emersonii]
MLYNKTSQYSNLDREQVQTGFTDINRCNEDLQPHYHARICNIFMSAAGASLALVFGPEWPISTDECFPSRN